MKRQIIKDMELSLAPFTAEQKEIYKDFHGIFGSVMFGFSNDGKSYCITDLGVLELTKNK